MSRGWGSDTGRWPPRWPVHTILLLVIAAAVAWIVGQYQYTRWTPLQQLYLKAYMRSRLANAVGFTNHRTYQFIHVVTHTDNRVALDDEVEAVAGGWALTPRAHAAGAHRLVWSADRLPPAAVAPWLQHWIYNDRTLRALAAVPLWCFLGVVVMGAWPAMRRDRETNRHQRRRRGPELMRTAADFNRRVKSDGWFRKKGIAIQLGTGTIKKLNLRGAVRLPARAEFTHLAIFGAPGSGKSSLYRQLILQARAQGHRAVLWDASGDWTREFFDPTRGDELVTPDDLRAKRWALEDEITTSFDADAWADAFFPLSPKKQDFFVEAPRQIASYLLRFRPSADTLRTWLSDETELDRLLDEYEEGRALKHHISKAKGAGGQRSGVMAALGMIAKSLALVPHEADTTGRWSTAEWAKKTRGFLFMASQPMTRSRLSPLFAAWIDMLILRTMATPAARSEHVPMWFFLDEFYSLPRLQQAMVALAEGRKSKNPIVLGLQSRAQLDTWYGHQANAMIACTGTQVYFRIPESETAATAEKSIGHVEVDRVRQSRSQNGLASRWSEQLDDQVRALFMASELEGWDDMHGILKYHNAVLPIVIPFVKLTDDRGRGIADDFVPRPDVPALVVSPKRGFTAAAPGTSSGPEVDWSWVG